MWNISKGNKTVNEQMDNMMKPKSPMDDLINIILFIIGIILLIIGVTYQIIQMYKHCC